jgi:CRP-like cAMP-binding protein/HEAT repeat protein
MLSWTAASTLFLQHYNAAQLPFISIASAVLIPLSGLVYIKLRRKLRFSHQFMVFAALFVLMPVLFRFLLAGEALRWPSLAFYVWYYMELAFAALLMDSFVNRMFNLRQTKRVFGPIATGSDLAGIPAGFLIGVLVGYSGVENLLLMAAATSAVVLLLFSHATRAYKVRVESGDVHADDADGDGGAAVSIRTLLKNPLVLSILVIQALSEFNIEFINNAFYSQTEQYLSQPEAMAAFLGTFFAIASIVSALVQMLASSRLMRVFGISGCLVLGPSLVALTLLAFVASSWIGAAPAFVFACMAGAKFVQYTVMVSVDDAARFTLVRSLPPIIQDRVLAISGTMLSPLVGGLSGLALLGMIHLLGAEAAGIAAVATGSLIVVIFIGRLAAKAYSANLKHVLSERAISGVELPLNDAGTAQMLVNMLSDADPRTAMCGLDLLSRQPRAEFKPALAQALRHADAGVRARAALAFQDQATATDLAALQETLRQESDPVVIAALLPSLGRAAGNDCVPLLRDYIENADERIAQGALVGLARHGGADGLDSAGRKLEQLQTGRDPARRAFVAETLGKIGASSLDGLIVPLLKDESLDVRRKAIEAARYLHNPLLGAPVVENLTEPELRPTVVETLIEGSEVLLPPVDELYEQSQDMLELRAMILQIYGRVKTAEGIRLLERRLEETVPELQHEAIMALAHSSYRPGDAGRRIIEALIVRYAGYATWLLRCLMEIGPGGDQSLLQPALWRELRKKQGVLFTLLGFLHPSDVMRYIRFAFLNSKSEDKVAAAIELLESMLARSDHAPLLPIFEGTLVERRVAELEKHYPGRAPDLAQRLRELLAGDCATANRWVAAVALDFLHSHADLARRIEVPENPRISIARAWIQPPVAGGVSCMSVLQRVVALKRTPIFADVPEEVLSEFAPEAVETVFAASAPIIRTGEMGHTLGVIVEGSVRIFRGTQTLAELGVGGVFGELAALSPEPRTANVTASESTRILELNAAAVERMIQTRDEAAKGIIRVLCQRIQTTIREKTFEDTGTFRVQRAATARKAPARMLQELEKVVWLKKVEIFGSLSDTILLHLARLATEQWLDAGDTLFEKGALGTSMYVIVEGEIAVHDEGRLIATLRPGEIVGELALLTSEVRSSSISAKSPARLLKITQSVMQELMWDHHRLTRGIIQILVTRLRSMMTAHPTGDAAGIADQGRGT